MDFCDLIVEKKAADLLIKRCIRGALSRRTISDIVACVRIRGGDTSFESGARLTFGIYGMLVLLSVNRWR